MRITLKANGFSFEAAPSETVLDAARRAGMDLPHACRGGRCGLCAATLMEGQIDYPEGEPAAKELRVIPANDVLLCRAHALSDLVLDIRPIAPAGTITFKRLPARVTRLEYLSPELAKLWLQLPRTEPLYFRAGQYLNIVLEDGQRRSYSIASGPEAPDLIELHLRRGQSGGRGAAFFDSLQLRMLLEVEGPLGEFSYAGAEADLSPRPLILLAGGTGFAPMKSILQHALTASANRTLQLYWGARSRPELYDHEWLRNAQAHYPQFNYVAVLSEQSDDLEPFMRHGLIADAVLADHADLSDLDFYAAGPPAMLQDIYSRLTAHGLPPERFHSDLPTR